MKNDHTHRILKSGMALGLVCLIPAHAAPPTVTPSPGYDARLQEQRAASPMYGPGMRRPRWVSRQRSWVAGARRWVAGDGGAPATASGWPCDP